MKPLPQGETPIADKGGILTLPWREFFSSLYDGQRLVRKTIKPSSVGANSTTEENFVVTGFAVGDAVAVSMPGVVVGISAPNARCATKGVVSILFANNTGGALTPPSGEYLFFRVR